MKNILSILFMATVLLSAPVHAENKPVSKPISHIILVWLKEPGNAEMRQQFVEASKSLNDLPGIINRHVGISVKSNRKIVDDSFDVAVTVTLKDEAALKAYMNHPKHKQIVHDKLKPLVGKIIAYDFVSP